MSIHLPIHLSSQPSKTQPQPQNLTSPNLQPHTVRNPPTLPNAHVYPIHTYHPTCTKLSPAHNPIRASMPSIPLTHPIPSHPILRMYTCRSFRLLKPLLLFSPHLTSPHHNLHPDPDPDAHARASSVSRADPSPWALRLRLRLRLLSPNCTSTNLDPFVLLRLRWMEEGCLGEDGMGAWGLWSVDCMYIGIGTC